MATTSIALRASLAAGLAAIAVQLPAQSMGPGSRATISIRASVMPRFSLSEDPQPAHAADRLVLASNAPSLRIGLVGEAGPAGPASGQAELGPGGKARRDEGPRLVLIVPD